LARKVRLSFPFPFLLSFPRLVLTPSSTQWEALEPPHLGTDGAYHHLPTYNDADRTPIPTRYLEKLIEVIYDARVLVKWQVGDLLVLDNHLVQHGREPWEGERKVLASLWDGPQALPYK
jgi:hypothetical protein